jgi:hypothetical protein
MLFPILIVAIPLIAVGWFIPQRMSRYSNILTTLVLILGGLALLGWIVTRNTHGYGFLPFGFVIVAVGYGAIAGTIVQTIVLFRRRGGPTSPEEQSIRWMGALATLLLAAAFFGRT